MHLIKNPNINYGFTKYQKKSVFEKRRIIILSELKQLWYIYKNTKRSSTKAKTMKKIQELQKKL